MHLLFHRTRKNTKEYKLKEKEIPITFVEYVTSIKAHDYYLKTRQVGNFHV